MKLTRPKLVLSVLGGLLIFPLAYSFAMRTRECPRYGLWLLREIRPQQSFPGNSLEFTRSFSAHGTGPGGADAEGFEFQCSDCVRVTTQYFTWPDPAKAQLYMEEQLRKANLVIAHAREGAVDGDPTVERAVVLESPGGKFAILRRRGGIFHRIDSQSLGHALAFEKQNHFELENRVIAPSASR